MVKGDSVGSREGPIRHQGDLRSVASAGEACEHAGEQSQPLNAFHRDNESTRIHRLLSPVLHSQVQYYETDVYQNQLR